MIAEEIAGIILSISFGVFLGVISGLIPGLHPNTFAMLLASLVLLSDFPPLYAAIIILSSSLANTFLDVIPSIFLGAPDPEMVLNVLPSHEMLLEGRGIEAVRLSALGSLLSVIFSFTLIAPLSLLFMKFQREIQESMAVILVAVSSLLILSESEGRIEGEGKLRFLFPRLKALLIFLLSGFLGYFAFEEEHRISSQFSSVLFPMLSGFFGASFLITALMSSPEIPEQKETEMRIPKKLRIRGALTGALAGAFVAWIPGVSSSSATVISRIFLPRSSYEREEFIISVSSVNTANMILSLCALFTAGKARTGAMVYLKKIFPDISVEYFLFFLLLILFVSLISYRLTIFFGRAFAEKIVKVNYRALCFSVLLFISFLVILMTGVFGFLIYLVSSSIGLLSVRLGVRRVNCMGSLLFPLILYYL